jgi:hypothetical protein
VNSPIRNNKLLREAYEAGRRQGLNEQGMMSNTNGGGNQSPSMTSNNSGTAVPNYKSGRGPIAPVDPIPNYPDILDTLYQQIMDNWGRNIKTSDPYQNFFMGDLNGDGVIDGADLGELLAMMGG